jgi:glycosyltransferase involved in cell wall biosynthesis
VTKSVVCIVIATFNSEATLKMVLDSICAQSLSNILIKILIVDGGSTDNTLGIAKQYKTEILQNSFVEPNYGKFLAYTKTREKFILFLDSDEVLSNKNCLQNRINLMMSHSNIPAIIGSGYLDPPHTTFVNKYINEFGDPFSFFVYRLSKSTRYFLTTMRSRYQIIEETASCVVFNLANVKQLPIIELTAGGSLINVQLLKKLFPETLKHVGLINHAFYLFQQKISLIAVAKNDSVIHYSTTSLSKYIRKISWRVSSNIHHSASSGISGFVGRSIYSPIGYKYLFIPYSFSIIFPLFDSLYLAYTRNNLGYLMHLPLCLITASLVVYNYFLKTIGLTPAKTSYGGNGKI